MKCLLIIAMDPETSALLSEEERDGLLAAHGRFQREVVEPGALLSSVLLADPSDTKTVRVRDDVRVVRDGSYAAATGTFAGYYLVECETLERATELAAAIPDAWFTPVEVRPLMHHAGMVM